MKTITLSPRRQLEAELRGAAGNRRPYGRHSAISRLGHQHRIGDWVVERDGRHPARIDAIFNGVEARVTFENGWRADLPLTELEILS